MTATKLSNEEKVRLRDGVLARRDFAEAQKYLEREGMEDYVERLEFIRHYDGPKYNTWCQAGRPQTL
jgi:hypothetical protein